MASIILEDHQAVQDLTQFVRRLVRAEGHEVRIVAQGRRLSVFGSTQHPKSLTDRLTLVMVHRGFVLQKPVEGEIDKIVEARAVLDRLALQGDSGQEVRIPPVDLTAVWAGVLPPRTGWQATGIIDPFSMQVVANDGVHRVAQMLPESPGQALVDRARQQVWSLEIAPGIPAAAAFALDAMGFLRDETEVRVRSTGTWISLSTRKGDIFVRKPLG